MSLIEVKVPDIGDFKEVDVIEVNVKVGDTVEKEQALLTLESDKASIEVPSDAAGVVKEIKVKPGDKVSEGTLILVLEGAAASAQPAAPKAAPAAPAPAAKPAQPAVAPVAGSYSGAVDIECDMVVLGAGPGGYSAAFRAADLGMKAVLIERYASLGGVCLNVGCIPSKALLHTAHIADEAAALVAHGISFGKPEINLDKLREFKSGVVSQMASGLAGMAKARKVQVLNGVGAFVDAYHLEVETGEGRKIQACDYRGGLAGGEIAVYAGRSACDRFDRCTGIASNPRAHAGNRWRHYRSGNGDGLFDARRQDRCG